MVEKRVTPRPSPLMPDQLALKKQAGSMKKHQNRKKQKQKTGTGGSQGGGCSGEFMAAPAKQSQFQSDSRSVHCDRGSQPRSSGKVTGPAPCGPAPHQNVRRDQSTRRDRSSQPRFSGKRTWLAPRGPAPCSGPANGEWNQRRKSGGNTVPPNDNRREHRDRGPAHGKGNTANPGREPRAGAGPNPSGRQTRTDSTTRWESQQPRDFWEGTGDTLHPGERQADRLPSSVSSTEPSWLFVKFL